MKLPETSDLLNFEDKYFDLVWLARKPHFENDPDGGVEYLEDTSDDIALKCRQQIIKIREKYPEEAELLAIPGKTGDWNHGFNSGCLATIRWVFTLMDDTVITPEETGIPIKQGGLEEANANFPFLDT